MILPKYIGDEQNLDIIIERLQRILEDFLFQKNEQGISPQRHELHPLLSPLSLLLLPPLDADEQKTGLSAEQKEDMLPGQGRIWPLNEGSMM